MIDGAAGDPCPQRIRRLQAFSVIALVVGIPIALGGVLDASRFVMVSAAALLVAAEWVPRIWNGCWPDRRERAWASVWLAVSAVVGLQLVPLPSAPWSWVGAYPSSFLALADVPIVRLSPMPQKTASYWATFSCYWALVGIVARLRHRDVVRLLASVVALATFEALYGLVALAHASESILGIWPRHHYLGDATGTFVNRNHFAGLLALCWPLGVAFILRSSGRSGQAIPPPLRRGLALLYSLLLGTAIFGSHSRSGLLAAFAGLAISLMLSRRRDQEERVHASVSHWIYAAVPTVAVVGAIWLGSGALIERLGRIGQDTDRLVVWSSLLELPARTWVLGAGAGAFPDVFKTVQPVALQTSYAYAHSDWLELLIDFGVVGVAVIALVARRWWREVRPARWNALHAGVLGGLAAVALHSAVDFDLHVPGSAIAFWAVVGIGVNRSLAAAGGAASQRETTELPMGENPK